MQTLSHFSTTKNVKWLFTFTMCIAVSLTATVDTFSNNVDKVLDKDIQLTFNGKTVDLKQGLAQSDFNNTKENKLMIEVKPRTFDAEQEVKLDIIMARGKRPFAKVQTNFSDQVEVDLSNLLLNAKPGDRIVLAFNDEKRVIIIPIS